MARFPDVVHQHLGSAPLLTDYKSTLTRRATSSTTEHWTEERVEYLKKLWADGLSASDIARELGGTSRNAVIGKVHRLGLSGRYLKVSSRIVSAPAKKKRINRINLQRALTEQKPAPAQANGHDEMGLEATEATDLTYEKPCNGVSILQLEAHHCRWPCGDPGTPEFLYCGNHTVAGFVYCAGHARQAYAMPTRRR